MDILKSIEQRYEDDFISSIEGMAFIFRESLKAQVKVGILTEQKAHRMWVKDRQEHSLPWLSTHHAILKVLGQTSDKGMPYTWTLNELCRELVGIPKRNLTRRLNEMYKFGMLTPPRKNAKYRRRNPGKVHNGTKLHGLPYVQTPEFKHDSELEAINKVNQKCVETLALNVSREAELHAQRRSEWAYKKP